MSNGLRSVRKCYKLWVKATDGETRMLFEGRLAVSVMVHGVWVGFWKNLLRFLRLPENCYILPMASGRSGVTTV